MERLGDDELLYIFDRILCFNFYHDRLSFLQVSKQFMKVACVRLGCLVNSLPDLLFDILPSSPNVKGFWCSKRLSNTHLKLLAQCVPNLLTLALSRYIDVDTSSEPGEFDFDDDGLCAVANACIHLKSVFLSRRLHVGDAGVVSLAKSCKNLTILDLEACIRITDESLKAIGESGIRNLNLGGCYLITDLGLEYLANGDLKNCLKYLNLAGCHSITDNGIVHLKHMVNLTMLNLSKCNVHITHSGIRALVSQLPRRPRHMEIEIFKIGCHFCG